MLTKLLALALTVATVVLSTATGQAQVPKPDSTNFISNRSKWLGLTVEQQRAYAVGAFDGLLGIAWTTDDDAGRRAKRGIAECVRALNLRDREFVLMISEEYARDAANWPEPAVMMLGKGLNLACRKYIEAA